MDFLAAYPTDTWRGTTFTWITRPGALAPVHRAALLDALQALATETYGRDIGGYFHNQPTYFDNMTRMVLARRDGRVTGFVALNEEMVAAGAPVLYLTSAIVAPSAQRQGVAAYVCVRAFRELLATMPEFFFAMRTQNPVVYAPFATAFDEVFPALDGRAPSVRLRAVAIALAATLSPECEFDSERFVIRGLYRFSQRFFDAPPLSGWAEVDTLFLRELDYDRQDGFLIVGRITELALRAAIVRLPVLGALAAIVGAADETHDRP